MKVFSCIDPFVYEQRVYTTNSDNQVIEYIGSFPSETFPMMVS